MKILIVSPFFWEPPNVKTGLLEVCDGLVQSGHQVDVIAPLLDNAKATETLRGIHIYRYKPTVYLPSLPYCIDVLLPFRIQKHLKSADYDFVIAITTQFFSTFATSLVKAFSEFPFAIWIHGATTTSGRFFTDILAKIYDNSFAKYSVAQADLVLALSDQLHSKAHRLGMTPANVLTACNAVNTDRFQKNVDAREVWREKFDIDNKQVILYTGRLVPTKGISVLTSIIPDLFAKHPDAVFIFAGDGPLFDHLKGYQRQYPHKLFVLPFIHDIENLLSAADLFVLPSFSEGVPQSILEAYACGLPVVTTRVGGIPDIFTDQENGVIIEARDPKQLLNSLSFCLEDKNRLQEIGSNNRKLAVDRFSPIAAAQHLIKILKPYL